VADGNNGTVNNDNKGSKHTSANQTREKIDEKPNIEILPPDNSCSMSPLANITDRHSNH